MLMFVILFGLCSGILAQIPSYGTSQQRLDMTRQAAEKFPDVQAQLELVEYLCASYSNSEKYNECLECYMMTGDTYVLKKITNTYTQVIQQYKACFKTYRAPISAGECKSVFDNKESLRYDIKTTFSPTCIELLMSGIDFKQDLVLEFPIDKNARKLSLPDDLLTVVSLRTCLLASMASLDIVRTTGLKPIEDLTIKDIGDAGKGMLRTCQRMNQSGIFGTYLLALQDKEYTKVDPNTYRNIQH